MQALAIVRAEHRSLAAVIHGLVYLAHAAPKAPPDFALLAAMLRYIESFPERFHHPKEDAWLFARLSARDPGSVALVELLKREHDEGARRIRALVDALAAWRDARGESARAAAIAFVRQADDYARFHWEHMRREELELMPRCEAAFTAADWAAVDAAFAEHGDPLSDTSPATEFAELFRRIVEAAPPPVGTRAS